MKIVGSIAILVCLSGCVTAPSVDSIVEDGGKVVSGGIGELVGDGDVTLEATDGTWSTYFSPDGEKRIHIKPLNVRETLSWRKNDDGIFCEEMYKPRAEECDREGKVVVMRSNGVVSVFTDGKIGKYPFKVQSGNSRGL